MAITIQLPNSNPQAATIGINQRIEANATAPFQLQQTNDFCYCAVECEYVEEVFAESGGEDYKNDHSSWLFRKSVPNDTITFELWKDGVKIEDLTDDTFGQYFGTFASQPLQTGFIISWERVFSVHATGLYQFRANLTILGDSDVFQSRLFRLYPYADDFADETVKIIGFQTGNIKGSQFDFTGLLEGGWPFYIRIDGELKKGSPDIELDNYLDSNERRLQIQDKLLANYELNIKQAPASVINLFLDGFISLGNNIVATDYNIFNIEIYRDLELYTKEINYDPVFGNRLQNLNVVFTEKVEGNIKRNF